MFKVESFTISEEYELIENEEKDWNASSTAHIEAMAVKEVNFMTTCTLFKIVLFIVGGVVVSVSDSEWKDPILSPLQGCCGVFLCKDTFLSLYLSSPRNLCYQQGDEKTWEKCWEAG